MKHKSESGMERRRRKTKQNNKKVNFVIKFYLCYALLTT